MQTMTLSEMLDGLRIETHISTLAAHGVDLPAKHAYLLNRVQNDLYHAHDWPHLKTHWDVAFAAGARTGALPTEVELEGIDGLAIKYSDVWTPLVHGIGHAEMSTHNSDEDERSDPIRNWQLYTQPTGDANYNQIEVWPLPETATSVRIFGRRKCTKLVDTTDKSVLDGYLVVLHAAAEILAAKKAEEASLKLQKAQERMRLLKIRQPMTEVNLSNPNRGPNLRPGLDYIPSSW